MAKHKYEEKRVVDAVGILDKNDAGEYILFVGDMEFPIADMLEKSIGTELHFKSDYVEV